jgi:pyruvate ferredoxin oxidoreductase gamma subunit
MIPGRTFGIRLESIGGLGAHTAAQALASAALARMGLCAAQVSSRGPERKGTAMRSWVELAPPDRPIHGGAMTPFADAIVVFHPALLREPRTFAGLRKEGIFIFNAPPKSIPEELSALPSTARAIRIDAAGIAAKEKCGIEAVLLGALCGALPFVDAEAVLETACGDATAKSGFRRGMKESQTLADVGEAFGDLPATVGALATQSPGGILSQPGNTVWNDVSAARSGFLPAFNRERCIHCGLCDMVCPDFCLVWEKGEEGGRFERELTGVDYRYCKGCMRCVESCPASAMLKKAETAAFAEQRCVPLFPELVQ